MDIYGIVLNGAHIDVSNSLKGTKQYATNNGFDIVSVRYNCGYIAKEIAKKQNGKWIKI